MVMLVHLMPDTMQQAHLVPGVFRNIELKKKKMLLTVRLSKSFHKLGLAEKDFLFNRKEALNYKD